MLGAEADLDGWQHQKWQVRWRHVDDSGEEDTIDFGIDRERKMRAVLLCCSNRENGDQALLVEILKFTCGQV